MDLKKELRIMVKYILPKEEHDNYVIENYVDTLALINEEYIEQLRLGVVMWREITITEDFLKENGFSKILKTYVRDINNGIGLLISKVSNTDIWSVHLLNYYYEGLERTKTKSCKLKLIKTKENLRDILKIYGINAI